MTSGIGFLPHEPPQFPEQRIADSPGSSIMSYESNSVVTPETTNGPQS